MIRNKQLLEQIYFRKWFNIVNSYYDHQLKNIFKYLILYCHWRNGGKAENKGLLFWVSIAIREAQIL